MWHEQSEQQARAVRSSARVLSLQGGGPAPAAAAAASACASPDRPDSSLGPAGATLVLLQGGGVVLV